jgi:hypothetical protein
MSMSEFSAGASMSDFGPEVEKIVDFEYTPFADIAKVLRVEPTEPLVQAAFTQKTSELLADITIPMIEEEEEETL